MKKLQQVLDVQQLLVIQLILDHLQKKNLIEEDKLIFLI